jgi:lipoprotein-releasing system permease protein
MTRPRQLNGFIYGVTALSVWALVGLAAALQLSPYTTSFLSPGPVLPEWIVIVVGLVSAVIPTILGVTIAGIVPRVVGSAEFQEFVRLHRGTGGRGPFRLLASYFVNRSQPIHLLRYSVWAGLVAIGVFGVLALARDGFSLGVERIELEPLQVGAALAAVFAGMLVPFAHLLVPSRMRKARRTALLLGVPFAIAAGLAAAYGVVTAVWPVLTDRGLTAGLIPVAVIGATAIAIGLAGVISRREGRYGRVVLLGLALLLGALVAELWLEMVARGRAELEGFGPNALKMPMGVVIAMVVAGVLTAASLSLLIVRFFFTFFTTVSIGGVEIGSMALVIVLSVMGGFENDLRKKIVGSNAHMLVTRADDAQFVEYREVTAQLADIPEVEALTPYLLSEVVIAANNNSNYANVVIKGIDPETVGEVTELEKNLEHADALKKLWPLSPEGEITGPPLPERMRAPVSPAKPDGGVVDPVPEGLDLPSDEGPTDFSASDDVTRDGVNRKVVDPTPPDIVLPEDEPIDLSGGIDAATLEPAEKELEGPPGPPPPPAPQGDASTEGVDGDLAHPYMPPRIAQLPGILAGRELARQLNLYDGEEVRIVSPLGQETPIGTVPRTKPMRVAGVFYTGMYEYDLKFIYIELGTLQGFLDLGDEVNGLEIRVEDPSRTDRVMAAVQARLGSSYRVQDWKEINRSLFSALKLEKVAMFLVLAITILVASFSIVGNLIMVVVEKSREIAVLKTLGASDGGVLRVFVIQGFVIGIIGTVLGVGLGLSACWLGEEIGLPLDPDVYYIDRLPIHVEPWAVVAVGVAGIAISIVATLYPAYMAARMEVVKGLRWE